MKQCETCIWREFKDDLICCNANHLHFAIRELLKTLPLIGKYIEDYECRAYERDAPPFCDVGHVNCRCTIYPVDGDDL